MELEELFGANVRLVREARGLTQAQLAERSGLSTGAIGQIERGQSGAKFATVKKLAAALDIAPTALFSEAPPVALPTERAKTVTRLTTRIARLDEEQLEKVDLALRIALQ